MLTLATLLKPVLTKMMDVGYPMMASIVSTSSQFNSYPTFRAFVYSAAAAYTYLRASGRIR
jgi:hypothetical protein